MYNGSLSPKILTNIQLTNGVTYTIKFKYKYLDSNYGGLHPIALKIIKDGEPTFLQSNSFASDNDWTEITRTFTPSATTTFEFSIYLGSFDSAIFNVLIDDVKVYDPTNLGVNENEINNSIS